jgi:hypothetical protein
MRRILRKILAGEEDQLGDTSTVGTLPSFGFMHVMSFDQDVGFQYRTAPAFCSDYC